MYSGRHHPQFMIVAVDYNALPQLGVAVGDGSGDDVFGEVAAYQQVMYLIVPLHHVRDLHANKGRTHDNEHLRTSEACPPLT